MADLTNLVKGGKGDQAVPENFDPVQISLGVQVEMEHTNDPRIAKEITMDHLSENPEYYSKLIKAGLADEFQPIANSVFGDPDTFFNDESRLGGDVTCTAGGNVAGKVGDTSNGQVAGRRSEPILNKTLDIELEEGKKKPKPTNPSLWNACKAWAKRTFDVYPSAYANAAAAKRYKSKGGKWKMGEGSIQGVAFDGPFPAQVSPDGQGTSLSGYDFVGYAENTIKESKKTMKREELKEVIKSLVLEVLAEDDAMGMEPAPISGDVAPETPEAEETETVTITLDKDVAQKLHDILMAQLTGGEAPEAPEGGEEAEAPEAPEGGEMGGEEGEINLQEAKKWIKGAIKKKGALKAKDPTPNTKLTKTDLNKIETDAKKKGDTRTQRQVNLARTLGKLKKKKG